MKVLLKCQVCAKGYPVYAYRAKLSKHCSRSCHNKVAGRIGGKASIGVSRNKGATHPYLSEYNRTHIKKGEQHPCWKGNTIGYFGLHSWVRNVLGRPKKCQHCGSGENVQWANRDKKYLRNIADWLSLCGKCHYRYDRLILRHLPFPFERKNRSMRKTEVSITSKSYA